MNQVSYDTNLSQNCDRVSYDTNLSQNCDRRTRKLSHEIWQLNKIEEYGNEEYMVDTTHTKRLILRETGQKEYLESYREN
jgi:hypothetical protein